MFFLLIFSAIVAFYFYVRKCNNYWRERGVEIVKKNYFFGTSFDMITGRRSVEQIHEDVYWAVDPNKRYVGVYSALKPALFVRDPELIHRITATDFSSFHDRGEAPIEGTGRLIYSSIGLQGEDWKNVRNKLVTIFTSSKMKKMYSLIEESAEMLAEYHLRPFIGTGKAVDVMEAMTRFTLDVIGKCMFGLQFNTLSESNNLCREVGRVMNDTGVKNTIRLIFRTINPKLLKLFNMKMISDEVENFFFDLLHDAEELRRKESEHRGDFLQLMLDIRDEKDNEINRLFTENHIASNMFFFYLAGHETTALTLSFALYELSLQPDIQEKLRHEIRKAREANNGVMNYQSVDNIVYLDMVISETLRLHPPVGFSTRLCTKAYQVPGMSCKIRSGENVIFSISAIHKDEKYFPNPLKFDPERFSQENAARMNPNAYMPFGSGPRICLGLRFAKLEMKLCLELLISRFKFSPCNETEVPIKLKKRALFHTPENGVRLLVDEI